jgi:ribosome-associated protein
MRSIPESEIVVDFARSSGPGGQNVNKRDTKAIARWKVGASSAFTSEEKDLIRAALAGRLNAEDEIVIAAEDERSQSQNRETALMRLQEGVRKALTPRKKRRPTRPSRASKEKRLASKRIASRRKEERRPGAHE